MTTPAQTILHLATAAEWQDRTASEYQPAAAAVDGFIHCCTKEQIEGVVSRYYSDRSDLVLLTVATEDLTSALVWEDTSASDQKFPHIYGPLNLEAVISAAPYPQ